MSNNIIIKDVLSFSSIKIDIYKMFKTEQIVDSLFLKSTFQFECGQVRMLLEVNQIIALWGYVELPVI